MKIERSDIPSIARGRVIRQAVKSSNRLLLTVGLLVLASTFIARWSSIGAVGLAAVGAIILLRDVYITTRKRKDLSRVLLAEWDKEHPVQ